MVTTQRIHSSVDDLTALRLTCGRCRTVVAFDLQADISPVFRCPNVDCQERWELDDLHHLIRVMQAISAYRFAQDPTRRPFDIALELPADLHGAGSQGV